MGQVRWAGWTMAIATALVISGGQAARADVASDKPAAIVIYPKIVVDGDASKDTMIRLTNTSSTPIDVVCFYIDANSHCTGGSNEGDICQDSSTCLLGGQCVPAWLETDFHITLTAFQPFEWRARDADITSGPPGSTTPEPPLPIGVCSGNPLFRCGVDADCTPFPGGKCSQSNAGTGIPPVPEDPFVGELKCIAIDVNGAPTARNDLKGEALLETATAINLDVASYNAIGIQAIPGVSTGDVNQLVLGGDGAEYNGCPNFLILNHFFDDAHDPVPGSDNEITTDLTLVPCSEDLLRQIPGSAVAQYLVFNEFEQRFSTSKTVTCFQEIQLCNIDTPNCDRSIFNVAVAGTLTGQTRINPIGTGRLPSGLLGVAIERHTPDDVSCDGTGQPACSDLARSAAFNLHFQGNRSTSDTITIP